MLICKTNYNIIHMVIDSINISELYNKNYKINIKNNKIIIVADNGTGKTTLLRLLYFFLTKQWSKLILYDFKKMTAVIDGKTYVFDKEVFKNDKIDKSQYSDLAEKYKSYSDFIIHKFSEFNIIDLKSDIFKIDEIEQKYDVPKNLIISLIESLESKRFDGSVYDWDANVIFLPTYRRIEQDYFSVYGDIDKRVSNYIINLLPEIDQKIQKEKEENKNSFSETEDDLANLFSRIIDTRNNEKWLKVKSGNEKLEMIEFGMSDVNFKISEFYEEKNGKVHVIHEFTALLNKYFSSSKQIYFDENQCKLFIKILNSDISLNLESLSSGEKQLISIFSHLFFDETIPFVILDEPEISLSIDWQEMLLSDIELHSKGFVIATHSPFIVNKSMRENTCGVNEFIINGL